MRTAFHVPLLTVGLSLITGCSMFVVSGGKQPYSLVGNNATKDEVRHHLGQPVAIQDYQPPIPLATVPELARHRAVATNMTEIASREDYVYRGWLRTPGPDDGTGYAMWSGCTLGLGEIFAFPASLGYAARKSSEVHDFQVWYSLDGHCAYYVWATRFEQKTNHYQTIQPSRK